MIPARLQMVSVLTALCGIFALPRGLWAGMEDFFGPPGTLRFGSAVKFLPNGNFVVVDPYYTKPGTNLQTGAVFLYSSNRILISTLTGSHGGDNVGSGGITVLANGNFVVVSALWDNAGVADAGAVTWGSMTTGVSGEISVANSLVGRFANDFGEANVASVLTKTSVVALSNGNYVVCSPCLDLEGRSNCGAVTWGDGTKGVSGTVGEETSLVGTTADIYAGNGGVTEVGSGNYVVSSPRWVNGGKVMAGAVTWCSGLTGRVGPVTATNSLVGTRLGDRVGGGSLPDRRIVVLSDGNYVVCSPLWGSYGTVSGKPASGAVTWCPGNAGRTGAVTPENSLTGTTSYSAPPLLWEDGNYPAEGVTALKNGNYVVSSPAWNKGGLTRAGAVTWCAAGGLTTGAVTEANSVTGSSSDEQVGHVVALSTGDYVIAAERWNNGSAERAGAVRLMSGSGPSNGILTSENSLVGTQSDDRVGAGGVTALTNGNFVISSPDWSKGPAKQSGAVTWVNGTTGATGPVTAGNSLTGNRAGALLGGMASSGSYLSTVTALRNGHYVVASPEWDNGGSSVGAVTWGNGTTGLTGSVTPGNSITGTQPGDHVGGGSDPANHYRRPGGVTALADGNYVIGSPNWRNGAVSNAGALTWASGTGPASAVVSMANSVVGSVKNQLLGAVPPAPLSDGGLVLLNPEWSSQADHAFGTVFPWGGGNPPAGLTGVISVENSVTCNAQVSGAAGLYFSLGGPGGTLVAASPYDNRITFITPGTPNLPEFILSLGNGTRISNGGTMEMETTAPAATKEANLFFENTGYARVTVTAATSSDPRFTVYLPEGGFTLGRGESLRVMLSFSPTQPGSWSSVIRLFSNDPETPEFTFTVTGSSSGDSSIFATDIPGPPGSGHFGNEVYYLPNGNLVITDPRYDAPGPLEDVGAVYLYSPSGEQISKLTGSAAFDTVGGGGVVILANGNYVILSNSWSNQGTTPGAGAITWGSAVSGVSGTVSAANSLVGQASGDDVGGYSLFNGRPGITTLPNGNYVICSPRWNSSSRDYSATGAVTWGNGLTGVTGFVSAANSILGYGVGEPDRTGESRVVVLGSGHCVVSSSRAVTWISGTGGTAGQISEANSLLGPAGDASTVYVRALTDGNYAAAWPDFESGKGAAAWGNGQTGSRGLVSAGNALVGERPEDKVGSGGITALPGGKYAVLSPEWELYQGAVTWGQAGGGTVGGITEENSLIGNQVWNFVGSGGLVVLPNGNVVISSPSWTSWPGWSAPNPWKGAVTLCHPDNLLTGNISMENSLVGCVASPQTGAGGVTVLDDGNFVVCDPGWNNSQGAVTWCSGQTGRTGPVSAQTSLTGRSQEQGLGPAKVFALRSGAYVVSCPEWKNGAGVAVGAVTRMTGSTDDTGSLDAANALTGSSAGDRVGGGGVVSLANGHFVVISPEWSERRGAVTWADGFKPLRGVVSAVNSLVGSTAIRYENGFPVNFIGDLVGGGSNGAYGGSVKALANGNYVVMSPFWSFGLTAQVGAVTFGDGQRGISGQVSLFNSMIGVNWFDHLGSGGIITWDGSAWAVDCPDFKNPAASASGVVLLGDGRGRSTASRIPDAWNSVAAGAGEHPPPAASTAYDSNARRWAVGRPNDNMVTLFSYTTPTLRQLALEQPGGIDLPSESTVDFGKLDPGQSADRTVTMVNRGGDPLHFSHITFSDTRFKVLTGPAQTTLPPGGRADFVLRFTADSPGLLTATMQLASDDPLYPRATWNLRGLGNPSASQPFGEQTIAPEITAHTDGKTSVRFQGVAGITYLLERSPDLGTWSYRCLVTANDAGVVDFVDDSPRTGSAFYRLKVR